MARRRSQSNGMLFMLALHAASQFLQLEHKPPVTAGLVLANVLVFLRPGTLDDVLPTIPDVCLNPHLVLKNIDLKRLFLSAFYHVDETHLVYNMLSLLWKGVQLENQMGSRKFASMVAVLLGMSHGLVVLLSQLLSLVADSPQPAYNHCAVGFSAVLFALKIVLNHNSPANSVVYGVVVPARYAAWAELILVQMFVPGTSFLGHLCGILAGLLYVNAPWRSFSSGSSGTATHSLARSWVSWSWMVVAAPFRILCGGPRSSSSLYGRGTVGSRHSSSSSSSSSHSDQPQGPRAGLANAVWRCSACTYDNLNSFNVCDMCGTPRPDGGGGSSSRRSPSAPPWPYALDDIRRARLARFSR